MNKLLKLFSILLLITLILVGCSGSDESNAKKVAEKFGKTLYTVDAKQVAEYKKFIDDSSKGVGITKSYETIQSLDKNIQLFMTKSGYDDLIANRFDTINPNGCAINNCTMQITNFILTQNYYDSKENTAGYYYEVKLKFIPINGNSEQTDVAKGFIGLSKENGQWKVSVFEPTIIPELLMKR